MSEIEGRICPECEDFIEEPGPAKYNCSRCGSSQVEERRCNDCHVFMAKEADETCPECEEEIEFDSLPVVTRWRTENGTFENEAEELQWIADAPKRAAEAERRRKEEEKRSAQRHREVVKKAKRQLPALRRLLQVVPEDIAPQIHRQISHQIEEYERGLEQERWHLSEYLVTIMFEELTRLVLAGDPHVDDDINYITDYVRGHDNPEVREMQHRKSLVYRYLVLSRFEAHPEFSERFRHSTMGSGCSIELDLTLDALLGVLDG